MTSRKKDNGRKNKKTQNVDKKIKIRERTIKLSEKTNKRQTIDKDLIKANQQPHKRPDILKKGHNFITNISSMRNIIDDLNDKEEAIVEKKLNRSRAFILNHQQKDNEEHQNNIQERKKSLIEVNKPNTTSTMMTRKEMIEKMKAQLQKKKREKKKLRKVKLGQLRSQKHLEDLVDEKKLNIQSKKRVRFNL
ncbi:55_t:CDS:2 [Ambispora leptoticha]|uniref:55_t:CDS:1 n=1 Tax=Ambispora leptoticha TaxID=144679 RepID=A0A9N8VSV9_9GLOM|nr:55_t:CDS:2 [Ambispora leptoticha]